MLHLIAREGGIVEISKLVPDAPGAIRAGTLGMIMRLASGCGLGGTGSSAPHSSPASDASAEPTLPTARSFDPAAADPFTYPATNSDFTVVDEEMVDGQRVHNISLAGAGGRQVLAYLIVPDEVQAAPAILYLHGFGGGLDRNQFLDEAIQMAQEGFISLHVQAQFPWLEPPTDLEHDQLAVIDQVIDLRRALDVLMSLDSVDPSRVGLVGHDFGAMYGALVAGSDERVSAAVLMAGTPRFANWFTLSWDPTEGDEAGYQEGMAPLDPAAWVARISPRPLLLQFGSGDAYVLDGPREEFIEAAGEGHETALYETTHLLNEIAADERRAWLVAHLE